MKRLTAIIVILMLLSACGKTEPEPVGYTLNISGVTFGMGADAEAVAQQLGGCTPIVSESCGAMGGNDYEYPFPDLTIYANDGGGFRRIYCVVLESDLVKTSEDISIGDTVEDVTGVYGEPDEVTSFALTYRKGGMELIFLIADNTVSSIQYLE